MAQLSIITYPAYMRSDPQLELQNICVPVFSFYQYDHDTKCQVPHCFFKYHQYEKSYQTIGPNGNLYICTPNYIFNAAHIIPGLFEYYANNQFQIVKIMDNCPDTSNYNYTIYYYDGPTLIAKQELTKLLGSPTDDPSNLSFGQSSYQYFKIMLATKPNDPLKKLCIRIPLIKKPIIPATKCISPCGGVY